MPATTTIQSNGSKWAGDEPDSIETLLDVLANHPLDRTFEDERFGNFVIADPVNLRGDKLLPVGGVSFFGNFLTLSHVFSIDSTDADVIARLTTAIRLNQQRPDYLAQDTWADVQAREQTARLERDAKRQAETVRKARVTLGLEAA